MLFPSIAQAKPWWKLLFGEGDGSTGASDAAGVGAALKSYITSASSMVYVANFSWGSNGSVNAVEAGLNTANAAGKDARVVMDDTTDTTDLTLPAAKKKGRVQDSGVTQIMHNKFIITDPNDTVKAKMATGSGNYSGGGWTSQNNTFMFLFGPQAQPVIQKYLAEFNEMWGGTFNGGTSGFNTDTVNGTTVNTVFGPEVGPWTSAGSLTTKIGAATKSVFFETTGHDPANTGSLSIDSSIYGRIDALGVANFRVEGVVNAMGGFSPTFSGSALAGYNSRGVEVRQSAITSFDKHHLKYFVVDQDWSWIGSVNASASSSQGGSGSDENGLLIQDFRLARELMKEFHRNYHLGSPVGSVDNTAVAPVPAHDDVAPAKVASLSITPGGSSFTASWTPLGATPDFHAYYIFLSTQAITTQADIGDRSDNDGDGMIDEDPLGDIDGDGDRDDDKDGTIDEDKSLRPEVRVFGIGSGSTVITTWNEGDAIIPARDYWFAIVGVDKWGNESLVTAAGPFQTSGGGGSPPTAAASAQYKSDGTTQISTGAATNESTVKFKAALSDADGQTIKLQVEIQPVGAAFANAANTTDSLFVASGGAAEVTWAGGVNGTSYHWQYRPVDSGGSTGTWASFGGNAEPSGVDFTVTLSSNGAPTAPVVTKPNGGEIYIGGLSTHTIEWTAATDGDGPSAPTYFIEYTTSSLNSVWYVVTTAAGPSPYAWNPVPNIATTQAKVRIKAYDGIQFGPTDESNATFTIQAGNNPPGAPTVLWPNGGETYTLSQSTSIGWTAATDTDGPTPLKYRVEVSIDTGTTWSLVAETTGTSLPWNTGASATTAGSVRVRATDNNGAGAIGPWDESNGFFTISAGGGGGAAITDLKISEVKHNAAGEDEFIELYNPKDSWITGIAWGTNIWLKRSNSTGGTKGTVTGVTVVRSSVPPKGYYLIANTLATGLPVGGADATYTDTAITTSFGIWLRTTVASDFTPTVIDAVGMGAQPAQTVGAAETLSITDPGATGSVERKASDDLDPRPGGTGEFGGNGWDTGNNSLNFVVRTTPQPQNSWSASEGGGGGGNLAPTAPLVIAPNGAETWANGTLQTISWSASSDPDGPGPLTYTVEYSTAIGGTWNPIASGVTGLSTGWTVSSTPTLTALVRVRSFEAGPGKGSPWDSSDGFFTITAPANTPPTAPVVGVPNGGENWAAGQSKTITWTAASDPDSGPSPLTYTIEYSTSGAAGPWLPVTSGVSGTAFTWTVPNSQTSDAFVRVFAFDGASNGPSDSSNAAFSISSSLLSIVISEVMHTGSNADNEFIELYNPTNSTITLSGAGGIRLVTAAGTGSTNFITLGFIRNDIKPFGYFLIGTTLNWTGSLTPDATYSATTFGKLASDSGVMITTATNFSTGNIWGGKIDAVGWGTQPKVFEARTTTSPVAGGSIERKATGGTDPRTSSGNSYDTGDNWNDFMLFATSNPQNSLSPMEVPALNLNPTVGSLFPNSLQPWSNDNTPNVSFSQSDINAGDTLKFHVQFDDDTDFSADRWVYFISALGAQGAASFDVGQATGTGSYPDPDPTIGWTEVIPDGQYRWQVESEDNSGALSGPTQAGGGGIIFRIDTVPPIANATLSALAGQGIVTLSWTAFTDATSGLNIYKVYRSTWSIPAGTFPSVKDNPALVLARNDDGVAGFADQSFPISELGNTTYYYRVTGIDIAGNESAGSNEVSAFPTALIAILYPTTVITGAGGDTTTEQAVPAVSLDITTAPAADASPFDSGAGDGWYTVPQGQTLYIDSFNVTGQAGGIIGVKLVVNFRVETGYGGTNPIQYQIQGGALVNTSIIPVSSQTTDTQMFFELPIDSWTALGELNIRFNNNDTGPADGVAFNWVRLEVIYASVGVPEVNQVRNTNTGLPSGGNDTPIPVVIRGNRFSGFIKATLGLGGIQLTGTPMLWPSAEDAIEIRNLVIPAGTTAGLYTVIVYTGAGNNTTANESFEVIDQAPSTPTVSNVIPNTGLETSTTAVEIQGTGFVGAFKVRLNDAAQTQLTGAMTVQNTFLPNQITGLSVPAGVPIGAWDVIVHAAGGTNTVSGVKFTVTAAATAIPVVTGIDPSGGANDISVPVTIFGSNFSGATSVSLKNTVTGGIVSLGVPIVNAFGTQITGVTVPGGIPSGLYDVLVTNAFGTNSASDEKYNASAPCANPGHIVISEVFATDNGTNGDFVELYNPTAFPISIGGWTLEGEGGTGIGITWTSTIPAGKVVPPKGYFLIADDGWATGKDNSSWPAADYDGENMNMAGTNAGVRLYSGDPTSAPIVDMVGWGAAGANLAMFEGAPIADPPPGKSAERKAYSTSNATSMQAGGADELQGNSQDTDNNANDWIAASSTPTPQNSSSSESCGGPIILSAFGLKGPTAGLINSTTFTFSIIYQHRDGVAPTKAQVIIDGAAFNLTAGTGTYIGGRHYFSSMTFTTTGAKKAFFYFEEGGFTKQTPLLIDSNGNFIPVLGGLLVSVNAWSLSDGGVTANPKRGSKISLAPTMTIEAALSPAGGFLGSGYKATLYYSTSTTLPPNKALATFAFATMTFVSSSGDFDLFTFTLTSGTHYRANDAIEFYVKGVDLSSTTIYDDAISTPTDNPAVGATIEDTAVSATGPRHWFVMASTGFSAGANTANAKMRIRSTIGLGAAWSNTLSWSDWVSGAGASASETNFIYNNQDVELTIDVVPGGASATTAFFYYTIDGTTPTTASRYFFWSSTSNFIGITRTHPSPQMASATRYTLAVPSDIHAAGRSLRFAAYLKDQNGVFQWSTQFVYKVLQTPGNPAGDKSATIIAGRGAASKKYPSFGFNDYSPLFHAYNDTALLAAATQQLKTNVSTPRYLTLDSYADSFGEDGNKLTAAGADTFPDYFYGSPISIYLRTAFGDSAPSFGLGSEAYVMVNPGNGIWGTQPDQLTPVDTSVTGGSWEENDPATTSLNQEALKFDWLYSSVNSKLKGGGFGDSDPNIGGVPEGSIGQYIFRIQDADGLGPTQYVYRGPDGTSRVTTSQGTAQASPWSLRVLQDDITRPFAYTPVYATTLGTPGTSLGIAWPRLTPGDATVVGNSANAVYVRVGLADTKDAKADFAGTDYRAITAGTIFKTQHWGGKEAGTFLPASSFRGNEVVANNTDNGAAGSFDSGMAPPENGPAEGLGWDSTEGKRHAREVICVYAFADNSSKMDADGTVNGTGATAVMQFLALKNTDGEDATPSTLNRPEPFNSSIGSKTGLLWDWVPMRPMAGKHDPVTLNGIWEAAIPTGERIQSKPFLYYRIWSCNGDFDPQRWMTEGLSGGYQSALPPPTPANPHGSTYGNDALTTHKTAYGSVFAGKQADCDARVHDRDYGWATNTFYGGKIISPPRIKITLSVDPDGPAGPIVARRKMLVYLTTKGATLTPDKVQLVQFGAE